MTAFALVVFDLDGTLVQSSPDIGAAVNDALRRFDLPEVTQSQIDHWIGGGTLQLLALALAHVSGFDATTARNSALLQQLLPVYNLAYQHHCGRHSTLYPEVRQTLNSLRAQGVKLALLTNKESRYTEALLAAHALSHSFDLIVSGDTLPSQKPDSGGLKHILAQFGFTPQQALMVGDSAIDAACARAAGVAAWLLPYGYNMGQTLADCAPSRIINNISLLLPQ